VNALQAEIVPAARAAIDESGVVALLRELLDRVAAIEARLPPALAPIPRAAEALGVSVPTVRRRIADGSLPTTKIGGRTLVDLARVRGIDGEEIAKLAAQTRASRSRVKAALESTPEGTGR
jgi:excisionase family DNA binding protein